MPHLAECLRRAGAEDVAAKGLLVRFRTPKRGVPRGHLLAPFDSGELAFERELNGVACRAGIGRMAVTATFLVGLLAVPVSLASPTPFMLAALPLGWLWLVGLNVFVGVPRLQMFIEESAAEAPRTASPDAPPG